ncbi:MAG: Nif3-like dinuclear metal center hexameric protein [Bryobacteraceae bacterium]
MNHHNFSRREFGLVTGTSLLTFAAAAQPAPGTLTARDVIKRIQQNVGVPWMEKTVDTFKTGNPDTPVKGICTTVMSTMDVLKKSASSGKNLIITHEPTFWNHQDLTTGFETDPVYIAKQDFVKTNDLVIWRFHDHWHRHEPDGILTGIVNTLGWSKYQAPRVSGDMQYQGRQYFVLPAATLNGLAATIQHQLGSHVTRVIGNPQARVSKVALEPGASTLEAAMKALERPDVDVLIVGEPREWEGVEYVKDAVACGENKALIILGHVTSEDPGMEECAKWLKTFITEVPIEWIPAGEPFWTPT